MKNIIETVVLFFCVIVVFTWLLNHGKLDFSGLDFVVDKSKEVVESETGKQVINEFKDIASDVAITLTDETKRLVSKVKLSNTKEEVTLLRVVDGDTIVVDMEGEEVTVRMIGIDTPESVNPDPTKNNEYGVLASNYTTSLLPSSTVLYLEFDEETEDNYGRILAYVWLKNKVTYSKDNIGNYMVNGILVKKGYAIDALYQPNDKYAADFQVLRTDAKQAKAGLWQYEGILDIWGK